MRSAPLFLSLFGITAAQSVFYKLTNDFTKFTDGEVYASTGASYGGTTCDNRLLLDVTKYMDHPMVRDHLCVNKCAVDNTAAGCLHFMSDEHSEDPGGKKGGQERSCMMRKDEDGWYQDSKPIRAAKNGAPREDVSMEWDYMCGRVDDERNPGGAARRRSGLDPDAAPFTFFDYDPPDFTANKIAAAKAAGIEFFDDYPNAFIDGAGEGGNRPGKYPLPQAKIDQLLCGTMEELAHICYYVENCTAYSVMGEQALHASNWITRDGFESDWIHPIPDSMEDEGGVVMYIKCPGAGMTDCGVVGRLYETNEHGSCSDAVNRYSMSEPHPILGSLCRAEASTDAYFEQIEKAGKCLQPQVDYWTQTYIVSRPAQMTTSSCPMGAAVEIFGGEHPVTGMYDEKYAGYYEHVGALPHKVMTTDANCGWQVREHTLYAPSGGGGGGGGGACMDDDVAINILFAQCDDPATCAHGSDPDFEKDMCKQLVSVWSDDQTIYCFDPMVSAVCRESCNAAVSSCIAMDMDAPICDHYACGDWPSEVDMVACPVKCARRLGDKGARVSADVGRRFAERLRKVAKDVQGRRKLQASGYDQIVYTTCTACGGLTTMGEECTDTLGAGGIFFGYKDFHSPIASTTFEVNCPASTTYTTEGGKYCSLENYDIKYSTNMDLVDNRCVRKCGTKTTETLKMDGSSDWCSGNSLDLDADDLSLCLPRETCEELCTSLGTDCVSIDMHRTLPRCYLNTMCTDPIEALADTAYVALCDDADSFTAGESCMPKAGDGAYPAAGLVKDVQLPLDECPCAMLKMIADPAHDFDLLVKTSSATTTGKAYPLDMNDDDDRTSFVTHTGIDCVTEDEVIKVPFSVVETPKWATISSGAGLPAPLAPVIGTRAVCEGECFADDTCAGFQFTNLASTISINNYTGNFVLENNPDVTFITGVCQFKLYSSIVDGSPVCNSTASRREFTFENITGPDRVHPRTSSFVQKIPYEVCTVDVTVPGYEGTYTKARRSWNWFGAPAGNSGSRFEKVDNTAVLTYVTTSTDHNSNTGTDCDGWAIFTHSETAEIVLESCEDDVAAAYEYLRSDPKLVFEMIRGPLAGMATDDAAEFSQFQDQFPVGGGSHAHSNFTCQWGADHGLCYTYVFPALCALTCGDMVPFTLDRGSRMKYKQAHGYANFAETTYNQYQYQDVDAELYLTKPEFKDLFGTDSCNMGKYHQANDGVCDAYGNSTCPHNSDCTDCRENGTHGFFCNVAPASNSSCAGDNNVAFFMWMNGTSYPAEYDSPSAWYDEMDTACFKLIGDTHYTYGDWPCSDWGQDSLIVRALCPQTCKLMWPGPPGPDDPPPTDESDAEGASTRKLTASFSGRRTTEYTHTYVPGDILEFAGSGIDITASPWVDSGKLEVFTYVPGSHDPTDPLTPFTGGTHSDDDEAYIAGTSCSAGTSFVTTQFDLLSSASWYRPAITPEHGPMSSARIGHICRGASICPELTTCALSTSRMHDELAVWRYSVDISRTVYLSTLDGEVKDALFTHGHYVPKVLTSTSRVEAIMVDEFFHTVKSIHRTDFGALRLYVDFEASEPMKYLVVTMFDKTLALEEGGRYVPVPAAVSSFYAETSSIYDEGFADVIRIDRFDNMTNGFREGPFVFEVYVPYWDYTKSLPDAPKDEFVPLDVYRFPPVISSDPVSILSEGGSVEVTQEGKIRVTVTKTWGDFVIYQDKNECAGANICDSAPGVGTCENKLMGYTCGCNEPYECSDGDCTTDGHYCRMKDDTTPDYYIKLSHTTRLDYGWRIKQVSFFSDEACTVAVTAESLTSSDGSYPHGSLNTNVDKIDAADAEWWSKCLTCNPEEVDMTHDGAAFLTWEFTGTKKVSCIKIEQSATSSYRHVAKGLKIERGPVGEQPSMTWTASCDGASCGNQAIQLGCGMPSTVLFGEVLEPEGTEQQGFYGSYGVGGAVGAAKSACHCHELCLRHVKDGCRSYKYYSKESTTHCILQTTKFLKYTSGLGNAPAGSYVSNYADYTSGTPMDRFATIEGTAPKLSAGEPLVSSFELSDAGVLTLHGYGFPVKNEVTKADQSRYQRIKLVPHGGLCTAEVPMEVSGIGCVETVLHADRTPTQKPGGATGPAASYRTGRQTVYTICSTRPKAGSTSEMVEFEGITILPGAEDTMYDACYCDGKKCSSPSSWVKIPGMKTVMKNAYSYEVATASFPRAPMSTVDLTVHGAVGIPYGDWGVKVVPAIFGCGVESPFTIDNSSAPLFLVEFGGTVDDVGEYTVCYDDGSGFAPLEGVLMMTALPTDRTHARNVFREQRWSVAAGGAARELSIKGTGLPAVLDSKVVLAEGETCEWPGLSFPGVKTFVPPVDSEAPMVQWSLSEPTTVVSSGTLVKLMFNEPLKSEGCEGNYSLKADPSSSVKIGYVKCEDAKIVDNYVLLDFSLTAENGTIVDGTYYVVIDSYAVLDMAGNYMLFQSSKDQATAEVFYSFTVGVDVTNPELVASIPAPSGLMTDGTVTICFSEQIFVKEGGRIDLQDCGMDMKCDVSDPLLARFHLNDTYTNSSVNFTMSYGGLGMYSKELEDSSPVVQKGYDIIVNVIAGVDFTVYDYRRYKLTIPAGDLEDAEGNPTSSDIEVEFLKDGTTGFDPMNIIAATSSSPTGLKFDVQLTDATTPGTYTMCYCNSNVDETLMEQGDSKTTYKTTFGYMYDAETNFNASSMMVGSRMLSEHLCAPKCHAGCIGSDCFCSGFDDAAVDATKAFCLSPDLCRETCDSLPECLGFSTTESDACIFSVTGNGTDSGGYTSFEKMKGSACTDPHDFETPVGKITVTKRAHIGAEYVVEPSVKTTIEVAGTDMMMDKGGIPFSSDRIMIVDCDGMCGYSDPSASVMLEAGMTFHDLKPMNPLSHDPPHDMPPNPTYDPNHIAKGFKGMSGDCPYAMVDDSYCPGDNYVAGTKEIVYEGFTRKVSEHLCYDKCIATKCEGDDCFCEGAYPGYDGPDSNAFCADLDLCQMLCDNDDTCKSIDMSSDRSRCFLNVAGPDACVYDANTLTATNTMPDGGYALYFKQVDQCEARRLGAAPKPKARALLPTMDFEYSHSKLLRFNGLTFTTGGSFKVCFCDATLLKPGETCSSPSQYGVEVGEVQASGISCLLKDSTYSRKTCYEMKPDGGLRCYDGMGPDTEAPRYDNAGVMV